MREIWKDIEKWRQSGQSATLATVVDVQGSSLRPAGSKMAISASGQICGSVTGGCVEAAVFEEAQAVQASGKPRLLSYGVSNEAAWEVGLSCGGSIQVFVESLSTDPWQETYLTLHACIQNRGSATVATVISGPGLGNKRVILADGRQSGDLGLPELDQFLSDSLKTGRAAYDPGLLRHVTSQGEATIFLDFILPPPRLVIVGAAHIAIPLVALANTLNFQTIVVDARAAFATPERFPHADQLLVEWPAHALEKLALDPGCSVVCLSHDEKLDNPALRVALDSPAGYIGALGSRSTHQKRLEALREMGMPEDKLARINAPVGLDLGARYPEEIALAILAEMIAERHAVTGAR